MARKVRVMGSLWQVAAVRCRRTLHCLGCGYPQRPRIPPSRGRRRREDAPTVALTVRVGVGLAFEIEAYRQKLGPIPPASAALFRHLLALDLAKAREETDTGVVDFPSSGSQEA
jgi:hypothetical protein